MKKVNTTLLHSIWSTTTTTEASYVATDETYEEEEEEEEDENYSLSTEPFIQSTKMNALQTIEEAMKNKFGSKFRALKTSILFILGKSSLCDVKRP